MNPIKKIVVGVDFSEATEPLLRAALMAAHAFKASVDVIHVREMFTYALPEGPVPVSPTPQQLEAMQKQIDEALTRFSTPLLEANIPCITTSIDGSPASQIVAHAEKLKADLILVGTHGRGGISHAILGSVAERVVQKARRPVLVVPIHPKPADRSARGV